MEEIFYTYGESFDPVLAGEALSASEPIYYTEARTRFKDIEPGISAREGMDRRNNAFFRPEEATPWHKAEIMASAEHIYRHNGLIKLVIDMMADFVTQGIEIYHPSSSKQKRYRHWWKKVRGLEVSERIVNYLFRHGNAVVKRAFADMNPADIKDLEKASANYPGNPIPQPPGFSDFDYKRAPKVTKYRIPIQYNFLNIVDVELLGGNLSVFSGESSYGLKIPLHISQKIMSPRNEAEKKAVDKIPKYLVEAVKNGDRFIELDPETICVMHYKKDDWQQWADPMILSIFKDIVLYDKMKDADGSALDGAISKIRLWKLGDPEHQIQPGPGVFKKLIDQLTTNVGGGSMDLVWDSAINLQETSTDVYKFLGSAKYEPVLRDIYAGLGIPQSLTGGGSSGGMTNNALSLKTLIERLQYARNMLIAFWEKEFAYLQRAFGDRKPAKLRFDMMSLSDEASENMLWVNLYDRNITSLETMRERFGMLNDVENTRIYKEYKNMSGEKVPYKLGPYAEAQPHPDQLAKAAMMQGTIAPTEAGVVKKPKAKGDMSMLDKQAKIQQANMGSARNVKKKALSNKTKKAAGQGRNKGQKDSGKRKTRTPKPIVAQMVARENLRTINDVATKLYLESVGKSDLRKLTVAQDKELANTKYTLLMSTEIGELINEDWVSARMISPAPTEDYEETLGVLVREFGSIRGKSPSSIEMQELYISAFMMEFLDGNTIS